MDCTYAAFGTAYNVTRSKFKSHPLLVSTTAAIAASYYAVIGPHAKSEEVLSISSNSSQIMENTWSLISLSSIKSFSLQASRLLKGAAIAERIEIAGTPCFILSKDPCQALSTAIKRFRRLQKRENDISNLGTILEQVPYEGSNDRRAVNYGEYPTKDLIFHLTGGGFFAHTLAGDIPFLLDWSSVTKGIIICPEYALLPENKFPVAIDEVCNVYTSILNGSMTSVIGFQPGRVMVTGESAGGNLAAALNIKLCMDGLVDVGKFPGQNRNMETSISHARPMVRLPDALLLCCPVLNLSLELSPSRVITKDAVLPSALINAISESYLGDCSAYNPLASPYYAPDEILSVFPPTLLYASSEDPLLDDAVAFNKRLKRLGVECDLRAAQNMPHAYWGLGTAGFPEARKVQRECQDWMTHVFTS